jgi:RNA polymerase sigma-70 factor, ECF subfamily
MVKQIGGNRTADDRLLSVMRLDEDRDQWSELVRAAQEGDAQAWPALIDRFEDLAVATAVGLYGDLDEAPDIAQEAFVLALRHIASLEDPGAFPAWLLRLVRTATNRRTRRRSHGTESLDAVVADDRHPLSADPAAGPEEAAIAAAEAVQVRTAVERLPEGERCVVTLHHLAGMPYDEVAAFLSISVPAAKKRAWSARARLKELLPMVTDALAAARPSSTETFRDTILVFRAIRNGDADALARLLARDPSLATASEDWSPAEGFASDLSFSERATALVRAAGTGDLRLVRLLVEAGAPVRGVCGCVDRESPLVTAVNIGAVEVVDYLLERGASLDDAAFDGGSTALHVAVHRERHDLVRKLLAAGADPALTDGNGRTAADWSALKAARRLEPTDGDLLWTRLRPIDLFAPLPRGALVHVPPAYGLGAMRTIYGIVDSLDAHWWMLGFEHGPFKQREFEQEVRDSGTPANIGLIAPGHPTDRRRQFAGSLERLAADPGPKVVMVVPAPGHHHDITLALPGLAADPTVLVTFVVATYTPDPVAVAEALPEGFDARITFDRARARIRTWPAVDPARTSARAYPDARHEHLASRARDTLAAYTRRDPAFDLPDPESFDDAPMADRAQALFRYLSHAFRPFEQLAAEPAADAPFAELLDTIEGLLEA